MWNAWNTNPICLRRMRVSASSSSAPRSGHERLMAFDVVDDLPRPPVRRIRRGAVSRYDLLELLASAELEIDLLHDRHQMQMRLHENRLVLILFHEL